MSSVAGWLSKKPVSLSRLRDSFSVMRKELPAELHWGDFGSQFSVLFEVGSEFSIRYFEGKTSRLTLKPSIRLITFAQKPFVEVKVQINREQNFSKVFDGLGLAWLSSRYVLAEQTSADTPNDITSEPGFEIVKPLAFAACGGITWVVEDSSKKDDIARIARQTGAKSDVAKVACWFNAILDSEHGEDRYKKLLERTPTYLFSILFDSRDNKLRMVGLRQNERENGENSPYSHLFYAKDEKVIAIARTAQAVEVLTSAQSRPILVANRQPVEFTIPV